MRNIILHFGNLSLEHESSITDQGGFCLTSLVQKEKHRINQGVIGGLLTKCPDTWFISNSAEKGGILGCHIIRPFIV
jgi:hypothetical protein